MSAAMTKEERERLIGRIEAGLRHPSRVEFVLALDRAATELRRTADYDELRARLDAIRKAALRLYDEADRVMNGKLERSPLASAMAGFIAALSPTDAGVTTRGGVE